LKADRIESGKELNQDRIESESNRERKGIRRGYNKVKKHALRDLKRMPPAKGLTVKGSLVPNTRLTIENRLRLN